MISNKKRTVYKSADTGRFVSKKFADKNPKTTYKTTVKTPSKKKS